MTAILTLPNASYFLRLVATIMSLIVFFRIHTVVNWTFVFQYYKGVVEQTLVLPA